MRRAYKFLARGAVGRFSHVAWPTDGAWIEAGGPLAVGRCGAHVCLAANLAHWLDDELWVVDVAGEHRKALDCVVVARARLVREIEVWRLGGAQRFAAACIARANEAARGAAEPLRALVEDAAEALRGGYPAVAAYTSAIVAARLDAHDPTATYEAERAWQSAWIAREIIGGEFA